MEKTPVTDLEIIGKQLGLPVQGVRRTAELLDEGNTIPFIVRFRRQETGGLDDVQVRAVARELNRLRQLADRRETIRKSIESRGKTTPELTEQIDKVRTLRQLEDIYLPYKPKKQTLAAIARSRGLEPFAEAVIAGTEATDLAKQAEAYVDPDQELPNIEAVLEGLRHLVADHFGNHVKLREYIRAQLWRGGTLVSKRVEEEEDQDGDDQDSDDQDSDDQDSDDQDGDEQDRDEQDSDAASTGKSEQTSDEGSSDADPALKRQDVQASEQQTEGVEGSATGPASGESNADAAAESGGKVDKSADPTSPSESTGAAVDTTAAAATAASADVEKPSQTANSATMSSEQSTESSTTGEAASEATISEAVTSEAVTSEAVTSEAVTSEAVTSEAVASEVATQEIVDPVAKDAGANDSGSKDHAADSPADAASQQPAADKSADQAAGKPKSGSKAVAMLAKVPKSKGGSSSPGQISRRDQRRQMRRRRRDRLVQSFKDYFDFSDPISKLPHHRILAINRGERTKVLRVKLEVRDPDVVQTEAEALSVPEDHVHRDFLRRSLHDAMQRSLMPSIEREVRRELFDRAEEHAVKVFARNLRQLLLQPPLLHHRVIAIDPGFRNGCKMVALDEFGTVLNHSFISLVGKKEELKQRGIQSLADFVDEHHGTTIAVGNGAACRETEALVADALKGPLAGRGIRYIIVNEAGTSGYSTSELGREELPKYDATVRSAVSIGRRLLDPLSELVKIDPANIGVGLYQHDVKAKHLRESLDDVVESCVNFVGVDVNSASPALLRYVAGLNSLTARRVFDYRQQHGPFTNREQLKQVSGVGDQSYVQATGFLKIANGDEPLDGTWIHPESYDVARKLLTAIGFDVEDLRYEVPLPPAEPEKSRPSFGEGLIADSATGEETDASVSANESAADENASQIATEGAADQEPAQPESTLPESTTPDSTPSESTPSSSSQAPEPPVSTDPTVATDAPAEPIDSESVGSDTMSAVAGQSRIVEPKTSSESDDSVAEAAAHDTGDVADAAASDSTGTEPRSEATESTATESAAPEVAQAEPDASASPEAAELPKSESPKSEPPVEPIRRAPEFARSDRMEQLAKKLGEVDVKKLAEELGVGDLLLQDIITALARPGRDPREDLPAPVFRSGILKLEDLEPGLELTGTVLNVVDFGAFVDIGLVDSGLIHVSRLADRFVADPHEVVSVGDILHVWVVEVDQKRRRVSLTAIEPGKERSKPESAPRRRTPRQSAGGGEKTRTPESGRKSRESGGGGRPQGGRPPFKGKGQKKSRQYKPKAPAKPVVPITKEMEEGKEPMRTFGDLKQLFEKKRKGDKD